VVQYIAKSPRIIHVNKIIKGNICLVCIKAFDSASNKLKDEELLRRFQKFVANHLKIPSFITNSSKSNAFCEKCELVCINPVCDIYLETLLGVGPICEIIAKLSKFIV